jgi:NAD(P)-dependent dehydrogenase (short-subunit alcohol dehydrogenase family)
VNDRVVLLTGAAQGCGRALALDLAHHGARLVLCDVNGEGGEETAAAITRAGGEVTFHRADISVEDDVAGLVDLALATYGRLDGAVNNAGTEITSRIADADLDGFRRLLATNLVGLLACIKHEIRGIRAGGRGGSIVNLGSVTSDLTGVPENGMYAASKGGVDALTKTAAIELAPEGIAVNALAFIGADVPNGMFQRFFETTDVPKDQIMSSIPAGRMLKASELGAAVRYLLSDDSRSMTGTVMVLDGGFTAQ